MDLCFAFASMSHLITGCALHGLRRKGHDKLCCDKAVGPVVKEYYSGTSSGTGWGGGLDWNCSVQPVRWGGGGRWGDFGFRISRGTEGNGTACPTPHG